MPGRTIKVLSLLLVLLGLVWFSQGAYIQAKAWLAQQLLQSAWEQTLAGQAQVRPWSWADTWPVARLRMPGHQVDLIVLEGATGSSLAFAPGHLQGTAVPGDKGLSIISAHRDTHFAFLRKVRKGDSLQLQDNAGVTRNYQVTAMQVVDADNAVISSMPQRRGILLVTCFPFDDLGGDASQRYLVYASEQAEIIGQDI